MMVFYHFYSINKTANQRPPAELGYEDGPWKGPGPPLLVAADFKASIYQSFFFDWTGRFIGRRLG